MTKFKKIVSGTLAGCLMASALMMSAGAANVQTTVISKAGVQAAAQTYSNTVALNSGMASQIVALPVYSGFSVCDLKVNNKAQGHVTVSIHRCISVQRVPRGSRREQVVRRRCADRRRKLCGYPHGRHM